MNETSWTLVAQVPLSQNLDSLVRQLSRRGVAHKVVSDDQRQSVWVEDPDHIPLVDALLKSTKPRTSESGNPWVNGTASRPKNLRPRGSVSLSGIKQLFRHYPVVMACLLLSGLGYLVAGFLPELKLNLMFQGYVFAYGQVLLEPVGEAMSRGEFWRLITPIFLHFGWMHLLFNGLWIWVFGSRLEPYVGSMRLVGIVLVTGLAGNVAQYMVSGPSLFGGMSGVNYGLLGYIWIRHQLQPHPYTALPTGLLGMMLFFLILGMTGALNAFAGGAIANAAHVGGLVSGMLLGGLAAQASKPRR